MLDTILLLGIQLLFFFCSIFAIHFAFYSAEKLSEWLSLKKLVLIFLCSAALLACILFLLVTMGWLQYGTPYDSPGFEKDRPKTQKPVEKAGPPPKIKKRVPKEDIESSGKNHQKKLKDFENPPSKNKQ